MKHLFASHPSISKALLCMGLFLAAFWGCGNPNQRLIEDAPLISRNFRDSYGRPLVLERTPKRVISLAANITETIYAIGAQDKLVAVSHDSDFPREVNDKFYVITYPDFDLPSAAKLQPDLLLASTEVHDTRIAPFFDKYNMKLFFEDYKSLEDIFQSIRRTGQMLGAESKANQLADSLARMTKLITDSTAGQIKYRTCILLGTDPITVVGGTSFLNDLIGKAGGKNVFDILPGKYPEVTPEQFILAAPEFVLIPTRNDRAWNDLVARFPEIHLKTPATELNHVYQMEPDAIVRPGPRIVEGLAYITRVLHSRVNLPF